MDTWLHLDFFCTHHLYSFLRTILEHENNYWPTGQMAQSWNKETKKALQMTV
jgi:hypothetical protein